MFCGILGTNFSHCQVTKALDALLVGLSDVAKKASEELGEGATEAQIVDRTIKLFLGKYESDRINFLIFHDRVAVFSNRRFFKLFRGIEPKCCIEESDISQARTRQTVLWIANDFWNIQGEVLQIRIPFLILYFTKGSGRLGMSEKKEWPKCA